MARTVTIELLFVFLIWGCAALNKEEAQAPKPSEPIAVPLSSPPVETARDQSIPLASRANSTPSKEEIRMLQARLKAAGFYLGPVDGIVG
jgi:peptidoglycan hydrolase-like protein with peptidoglycan-binding domain